MRQSRILAVILFLIAPAMSLGDSAREVEQTLDAFHQAAATADLDSYLGTVTENVVFLGTDGDERWQGQAFRDFVESNFSAGRGWVYKPVARKVQVNAGGTVAWFDESLENTSLGRCRGSGVLVKTTGGWRIAQYNLSVPVPNAMVEQVVADIAAMESAAMESAEGQGASTALAESADAGNPSVEQVSEPPPREDCGRKRHKTNRKAGC